MSRDVYNVAGYVPGATDEYVIIGAHYDHLGLGEQYSLAPEKVGTIHPGADDNASGAAGSWRSRDTSVLIRNPHAAFCLSRSPAKNWACLAQRIMSIILRCR